MVEITANGCEPALHLAVPLAARIIERTSLPRSNFQKSHHLVGSEYTYAYRLIDLTAADGADHGGSEPGMDQLRACLIECDDKRYIAVMTPDELRRSQIAMALTKPVSGKMLDVMDMVIMPEMRDAIMLTLSEGGDLDMTARIERLVEELIDFLQRGDTKMERDVSLLMAKMIMEACARRLDNLSSTLAIHAAWQRA